MGVIALASCNGKLTSLRDTVLVNFEVTENFDARDESGGDGFGEFHDAT